MLRLCQWGPYDDNQLYANHSRSELPLSYCDNTASNTTVGDVLDQGVVMMGCRVNGEHPERSTKWTWAPVLDQTLQSKYTHQVILHCCSLHTNIQLQCSGSPLNDVPIFNLSSMHISSWSVYYRNMKSNKVWNKNCLVMLFVWKGTTWSLTALPLVARRYNDYI